MLGNGRLEAFCFDGIKRLCHIRGKLRKKVWINQSDIILVGLRDYQDTKADVIMKYTADEARNLRNYGEIPENVRIEEGEQEEELVQFDNYSSEDEVDEIDQNEEHRLWGGRFDGEPDEIMRALNDSIHYDKTLWKVDLKGSKAYAKSLAKTGLITENECELLVNGLDKVGEEWSNNTFEIKSGDEDIHTANERRLKELIGAVAGKLHTGRSRNDQTMTDTCLWLRDAIDTLSQELTTCIKFFLKRAEKDKNIIFPGYTHLQRAQPIRWSHWILCYVFQLKRDLERLFEVRKRVNVLPLGCGALAGNPFGVDRAFLAKELGFETVSDNSLDTVGSRDAILEFLQWASMTSLHLSRWAEDLIIYSSKEFSFVTLSDTYSTGSSLMPQKKNADSLELIRGKAGRVYGLLTSMSCIVKGLPMTYNKDLQEDKQSIFEAFGIMQSVIKISGAVLHTLTVNEDSCTKALSADMLATDLAYFLVRKGVPFREAHEMAGKCVALAEKKKVLLSELTLSDFQGINQNFDETVLKVWNYEQSVEQYTSYGGTSLKSVEEQIKNVKQWLADKEI
ncbi:DgyrCDS6366 [Dimorphilus gyrociliatus]|uniref:Eukaryotic translation initiation factor 4C n=1 Tax=Dimorphilus gyrociliatus TaxID=2664684 RepID=A0A7I8VQN0_9ANNE|nr:DgyrCDS6366 [Dimorphilus gyrociliatus]